MEGSDLTTDGSRGAHSSRPRRDAIRADVANPDTLLASSDQTPMIPRVSRNHIVRIVTGDGDKGTFTEVTQEQIDRVRMMHDRMSEGASFSFNYNTLLLVASVLAGLGMVSNSATTIIASMLVSPIMGPVIGLAYGSTIRDWDLVLKSIKVECISLLVCIVVGVVIAAITGPTALSKDWPTDEMNARADTANFIVALPIAFFSGLGVAVSLLDDQTSSLVGVAISASLLPPAVNCGIFWTAFVFHHNDLLQSHPEPIIYEEPGILGWQDVVNVIELYETYADEDLSRVQYRRRGLMSLFLTLANIILIWISGMLMFRLKEVLPVKKKVFWEDLTVARKIYQRRAVLQQATAGDETLPEMANTPTTADTSE